MHSEVQRLDIDWFFGYRILTYISKVTIIDQLHQEKHIQKDLALSHFLDL